MILQIVYAPNSSTPDGRIVRLAKFALISSNLSLRLVLPPSVLCLHLGSRYLDPLPYTHPCSHPYTHPSFYACFQDGKGSDKPIPGKVVNA